MTRKPGFKHPPAYPIWGGLSGSQSLSSFKNHGYASPLLLTPIGGRRSRAHEQGAGAAGDAWETRSRARVAVAEPGKSKHEEGSRVRSEDTTGKLDERDFQASEAGVIRQAKARARAS